MQSLVVDTMIKRGKWWFLCYYEGLLYHISFGLVHEKRNSIANALELLLYCSKPSVVYEVFYIFFSLFHSVVTNSFFVHIVERYFTRRYSNAVKVHAEAKHAFESTMQELTRKYMLTMLLKCSRLPSLFVRRCESTQLHFHLLLHNESLKFLKKNLRV